MPHCLVACSCLLWHGSVVYFFWPYSTCTVYHSQNWIVRIFEFAQSNFHISIQEQLYKRRTTEAQVIQSSIWIGPIRIISLMLHWSKLKIVWFWSSITLCLFFGSANNDLNTHTVYSLAKTGKKCWQTFRSFSWGDIHTQ